MGPCAARGCASLGVQVGPGRKWSSRAPSMLVRGRAKGPIFWKGGPEVEFWYGVLTYDFGHGAPYRTSKLEHPTPSGSPCTRNWAWHPEPRSVQPRPPFPEAPPTAGIALRAHPKRCKNPINALTSYHYVWGTALARRWVTRARGDAGGAPAAIDGRAGRESPMAAFSNASYPQRYPHAMTALSDRPIHAPPP